MDRPSFTNLVAEHYLLLGNVDKKRRDGSKVHSTGTRKKRKGPDPIMHTSGSHRRPSYLLNASPLYSNSAQLKTTNKLGDVVLFLFNMRFSSRTLIGVKKKQKFFLIQVR